MMPSNEPVSTTKFLGLAWLTMLVVAAGIAGCTYPEYTYVDKTVGPSGSGGSAGSAGNGGGGDSGDADESDGPTDTTPDRDATDSCDEDVNLALDKPATTSSVQSGQIGAYAVDGSTGTRWWTLKTSTLPSEWIVVDLGARCDISRAVVNQDDRYAKNFTIQISTDNVTWTTAASTTSGIKGATSLSFATVAARYVKMDSTLWYMDSDRVKLMEFEVYR
jgi:hypothetical protein